MTEQITTFGDWIKVYLCEQCERVITQRFVKGGVCKHCGGLNPYSDSIVRTRDVVERPVTTTTKPSRWWKFWETRIDIHVERKDRT